MSISTIVIQATTSSIESLSLTSGNATISSLLINRGITGPTGPNSVTTATATDLVGILKGDGANVATAIAGTDYEEVGSAATAQAYAIQRGNHTGTQTISTVTGLEDSLSAKASLSGANFTGNVGIGTTTPNEKLTVVGNISATGNLGSSTADIPIITSDTEFTGQITAPNQTLTNDEDVVTKALLDEYAVTLDTRVIDSSWSFFSFSTGGGTAAGTAGMIQCESSSTAGGYGMVRYGSFNPVAFAYNTGGYQPGANTNIDYSKRWFLRFRISGKYGNNEASFIDADGWFKFGVTRSEITFGLVSKGIGLKMEDGVVYGCVHDGSTLTVGDQLWSWAGSWPYRIYEVLIMNNGDGTVGFYVDGTLTDTLTGGPTGYSGQEGTQIGLQTHNNTTAKTVGLIIAAPMHFKYLE